jgi:hypothetical protein
VKKYCVINPIAFVEEIPSLEKLTEVDPDIIVVASYGKIIPDEIINFPKHGALNIHPSLLPKYRGPSPVQTALLKHNIFSQGWVFYGCLLSEFYPTQLSLFQQNVKNLISSEIQQRSERIH